MSELISIYIKCRHCDEEFIVHTSVPYDFRGKSCPYCCTDSENVFVVEIKPFESQLTKFKE